MVADPAPRAKGKYAGTCWKAGNPVGPAAGAVDLCYQ